MLRRVFRHRPIVQFSFPSIVGGRHRATTLIGGGGGGVKLRRQHTTQRWSAVAVAAMSVTKCRKRASHSSARRPVLAVQTARSVSRQRRASTAPPADARAHAVSHLWLLRQQQQQQQRAIFSSPPRPSPSHVSSTTATCLRRKHQQTRKQSDLSLIHI